MDTKKYQRKLIPFNLVIVVISLVAAISLLFAPIIKIDLSKGIEAIVDIAESGNNQTEHENFENNYDENNEFDESDGLDGEHDGDNENEPSTDFKFDMSGFVNTLSGFKFSITAMDAAKLATSKEPTKFMLTATSKVFARVADKMFVNVLIDAVVASSSTSVNEENLDRDEIFNKFEEIGNAKNDSEADIAIQAFTATLAAQGGISDAEQISAIESTVRDLYDETVKNAGEFTVEAAICVMATSSGASDRVATSYGEMFLGELLEPSSDDTTSETAALYEKSDRILKNVGLGFFLFILFFAVIWFIQALFAFFHIFSSNKRFSMWYTRLFGLIPCLIFGIVPLIMQLVFKSIAEVAFVAAIFTIMSTLTWISGACYVVAILLSLFWARPIKRKIRKIEQGL